MVRQSVSLDSPPFLGLAQIGWALLRPRLQKDRRETTVSRKTSRRASGLRLSVMNIYRFLGDMSHLAAKLLLVVKLDTSRSAAGEGSENSVPQKKKLFSSVSLVILCLVYAGTKAAFDRRETNVCNHCVGWTTSRTYKLQVGEFLFPVCPLHTSFCIGCSIRQQQSTLCRCRRFRTSHHRSVPVTVSHYTQRTPSVPPGKLSSHNFLQNRGVKRYRAFLREKKRSSRYIYFFKLPCCAHVE